MMKGGNRREVLTTRVLVRLVGNQRDALHAFVEHLTAQLIDAQHAVDRLATGHGHRIVVENLVSNVDLGRHCRTQRQVPRVKIGAVAQVLENVRGFGERCLTDPSRPRRPSG